MQMQIKIGLIFASQKTKYDCAGGLGQLHKLGFTQRTASFSRLCRLVRKDIAIAIAD
jgi:hypothetical protein